MPSPAEEIFKEIVWDFSIHWNFPNCIESIEAKYIRIHFLLNSLANILTTNSAIPSFCRQLWMQIFTF